MRSTVPGPRIRQGFPDEVVCLYLMVFLFFQIATKIDDKMTSKM